MAGNSNLALLKNAYAIWHEHKGARTNGWLDLVADDFRIISMGEDAKAAPAPLAFGATRRSKEELVGYFTALLTDWNMVHWTAETYTCEGERIAMFGRCGWTHKKTGKHVETRIAHQWTFRNGKAIELIELFDSARVVAAAS